jgi:DNA-binding transcriptional MerR regulator
MAGNRRAVASLYGVSVSTVIRWERQGALPPPVRMTPNGERLWDLGVLRERFQRAAIARPRDGRTRARITETKRGRRW